MKKIHLIAACAILAAAIGVFALRVSRDMRDFEVWWTAAGRATVAEPLFRAEDEHYQFKYLPAFAVLAIPLGLLPLPVAKVAWFVASIGLLIVLMVLSVRLLPDQRQRTALLSAIAVVVLGKFYVRELDMGQVNLVFAVTATGAFLAMKERRELPAAALLVLTIAIKPYGALLLPFLLVRRQRAASVAAGIGVGLLLVLPVPLYGVEGTIGLHQSWWQTIAATTAPNLLNPDNVSLASMFAKWLGIGGLSTALATISALTLLAAAAMVFMRREQVPFPEGLEGGLLLLLIPLLSPQGWDYVLLIATPAVIFLANYWNSMPSLWRWLTVVAGLTIGLSLFDLMGRAAYTAFMGASAISLCALVLVAALATLRFKGIA